MRGIGMRVSGRIEAYRLVMPSSVAMSAVPFPSQRLGEEKVDLAVTRVDAAAVAVAVRVVTTGVPVDEKPDARCRDRGGECHQGRRRNRQQACAHPPHHAGIPTTRPNRK